MEHRTPVSAKHLHMRGGKKDHDLNSADYYVTSIVSLRKRKHMVLK